ncbi:MAG: hypothetical protein KGZ87_03610 [Bacteroidetes bacterium]|nr:hypothetical protein [Bacteroidota bacterium]
MKDSISIIAHRGASYYEPENSIMAVRKAFELYSDAVEVDLWTTKDDSIVVFHDLNTFRITQKDYIVPETSSQILRNLDIGKGQSMPFLREVLDELPIGKKIYLDIKWYTHSNLRFNKKILTEFISQLEKSGRISDIDIVCFDYDYISRIKAVNNKINCHFIAHEFTKYESIQKMAEDINVDGLSIYMGLMNFELVNKIKTEKKKVYSWTIVDPIKAVSLYDEFKIDGLFTNRPDYIRMGFKNKFY